MTDIRSIKLRQIQSPIVAVVPIHGGDATRFSSQLMSEFTRLGWDVVWHINNMGDETAQQFIDYPGTLGYSFAVDRKALFIDDHRQAAVEMAQTSGAEWLVLHDADETLEPAATEMLKDILQTKVEDQRPMVVCHWYNIWRVDGDGTIWVRVDPPFIGYRKRFHPVGPYFFRCKSGIASLVVCGDRKTFPPILRTDLRILHWGFSSKELRQAHYDYWMSRRVKRAGGPSSQYWNILVLPQFLERIELRQFDPGQTHIEFLRAPSHCESEI